MTKYILIFLSLFHIVYADINSNLNTFFDKCGSSINVNQAEVYDGQKAGYITGGGVTLRSRVMDSKLVTVNLPRFDAGCGGIDIYAGGFSFINRQALLDNLKSIGSSAIGYSFLLGLETVSPQVANTIKQLQTWANTINSQGINSCETGSTLVGAVWPKNTMASQHICRTIGNKDGVFSDFIAARQGCAQQGEYQKQADKLKTDAEYAHLLGDEYNIAWEAIQKNASLASDPQAAELLMSLMGTVVVKKEPKASITSFPSLIDDESFLSALLTGGSTSMYTCTDNKDKRCLVCKKTAIKIAPQETWIEKVRSHLIAMQQKILADQELNQEEKALLTKSKLPLYKIVNVLTAYKRGHCPIDLYQVSDIVAMDLLAQYLREAVTIVREGAAQLKRGQMYCDAVDEYLHELDRIERVVRYYETRTMRQMEQEFQLMNKLQLIEQQIASEIVL